MSWDWRIYVLWVLLAGLIQAFKVESCIEEERLALLDLNSYFRSHGDPYPWRSGLADGEKDEYNCCTWERVQCNSTTQHVIELDLSDLVLVDSNQSPWVFNVTMLQTFRQLMSLDLSQNSIGGLVDKNGSTRLSTLKNLQSFTLDGNDFENGYISLRALTSLKTLSLKACGLNESTFPIQELENLTKLKVLDLSWNELSSLNFQGICKLKNILEVYLQGNRFTGQIPLCLSNCSSLQVLDLSDNPFEGKFSLSLFANFTKLRFLDLSVNQLVVQTEDSLWHPSFQLQYLYLQGCNVNKPDGTIPEFLRLQHNLSEIRLSDNQLVGSFPTWLITNNPRLQVLELENNSFTGYLKLPSYTWQSLQTLDISRNKFQGKLPNNIGYVFPQLWYFFVAENHFEGSVPNSIAHMSHLQMLDLSHNNFSGELPTQLLSNCTNLVALKLNDNNLQGEIVPEHMNLRSLSSLDVSNNNFGGTIKDALLKSSRLMYLDMSKNKVTGQLPNFIGNLQYLGSMSLSSNNLQGYIPIEICKLHLSHLDLSENKLHRVYTSMLQFFFFGISAPA